MVKVLYVPLDERACNYSFPQLLAAMTDDIELLVPDYSWMGFCKKSADCEKIWQWVFERAPECEYAILSVDTLVYGNIVNSRIHQKSEAECQSLLDRFVELKQKNPRLKIHAFNLAARVAAYNSATEDPDYWATHGWAIWRYTYLTDKKQRGHTSEEEIKEMLDLEASIPAEYLEDFLRRRVVDRATNLRCVQLTADNVFDVLTVPKDDTAEYGYAAMDQKAIAQMVQKEHMMHRVLVYPGADEVGSVIFARVFNLIKEYIPRVYPRFSSVLGPQIIPRYEDRPIYESLKSQIYSAGGICVETAADSDCMVALNTPGTVQIESTEQYTKDLTFSSHINMHEFLRYILYYRKKYNRPVGVAEVSVSNGCENEFMEYAMLSGVLHEVQSVGGWNTTENTVGVVLAETIIASYYNGYADMPKQYRAMEQMKMHAIVSDWLFQSNVLHRFLLETRGRINPYALSENYSETLEYVASGLKKIIAEKFGETYKGASIELTDLFFNWDMVFMPNFGINLEGLETPSAV